MNRTENKLLTLLEDTYISMPVEYADEFQKEWNILLTTGKMIFEKFEIKSMSYYNNHTLKYIRLKDESHTYNLDLVLKERYSSNIDSQIKQYEFGLIGYNVIESPVKVVAVGGKTYKDPHLILKRFREDMNKFIQ